ncbi:hypothetical protein J6G99_04270 [bacterium]|nr:hypothetical protein [bacterium]
MDNINFTGGFLIKKPSTRMWHNIENILPRKKAVFQQFNEDGDKFFAVKTFYDKQIADFILNKHIDFKFYPDINLKTQLDPEKLAEAKKIINSQKNIIEIRKDLRKFFKPLKKIFKPKKYKWKPNDHILQTFKALGLNSSECTYSIKNGITIIKDSSGKIVAKASPNSHFGTNYVYVLPKNSDGSPKKFAVDFNGNIVHEFKEINSKSFRENFLNTIKIDLGRIRPQ